MFQFKPTNKVRNTDLSLEEIKLEAVIEALNEIHRTQSHPLSILLEHYKSITKEISEGIFNQLIEKVFNLLELDSIQQVVEVYEKATLQHHSNLLEWASTCFQGAISIDETL